MTPDEPMKTEDLLDEIGLNYNHRNCPDDCLGGVAYRKAKSLLQDQQKQLLKRVREIIGEDEIRPESGPKRNGIEQGLRRTRNKLRAEQRAKLDKIEGEV